MSQAFAARAREHDTDIKKLEQAATGKLQEQRYKPLKSAAAMPALTLMKDDEVFRSEELAR